MNRRTSTFLALLAAAALLPSTSSAHDPDADADKTLSPYFVVKGGDPGVDTMPLKGTSADVDISGVIARVKVTQIYENTGRKPLEAIYVFPGSTRAAVFGMRMTVGERVIVAQIKKRDEARKIYEAAKEAGKSASLLEQQRPNVFTMNVANILPGDTIKVEMDYTELLVPDEGIYELTYPAVVGPRYTTATDATAGSHDKFTETPYQRKGEGPSYAWGMDVRIDAGVPIAALSSPSHEIDARVEGSRAQVGLADGSKGGDADFVLRYGLRGNAVTTGVLLYEGDEESFFLAMVQPPKAVDAAAMPAREYVFIVDVSGSMHGFPLDTAKKVLRELFKGLRSQDRFNVMMFSGGQRVLAERSVPANRENLQAALSVIGGENGGGGTEILPALKRALAMPAAKDMSRTFVVVTDGYVSVEAETFELIRASLGEANLFSFGIGTSVNRFLVEGMARAGMGEPFVVLGHEQAEKSAEKFRRYIESPALTNISVDFPGLRAYDVEPKAVPDLFAQRPVIVFGKYRGKAQGKVVVRGTTSRGQFEKSIDLAQVQPSKDNSGLRYLWARHRISQLADINQLRNDDKRVAEVTELGLKYNLMTAHTSFVAVDERVRNQDGTTTVKQPLPLPAGVEETAVGVPPMAAPAMGSGMGAGGGYGSGGYGILRARKAYSVSADTTTGEPKSEKDENGRTAHGLTVLKLSVSGALTEAQVRARLPLLERMLRACVKRTGKVALKVRIDESGNATIDVPGLAVAADGKNACTRLAAGRLKFAPAGGLTTVELLVELR